MFRAKVFRGPTEGFLYTGDEHTNIPLQHGKIFVGSVDNLAVGVVVSGDITIDDAGVSAFTQQAEDKIGQYAENNILPLVVAL